MCKGWVESPALLNGSSLIFDLLLSDANLSHLLFSDLPNPLLHRYLELIQIWFSASALEAPLQLLIVPSKREFHGRAAYNAHSRERHHQTHRHEIPR